MAVLLAVGFDVVHLVVGGDGGAALVFAGRILASE